MWKSLLAAVLIALPPFATAEVPDANTIIERARQNSAGFSDMIHEVRMILIDANGERSEREMLLKARSDEHGNSSSLSIFTAPQREKGIALLTHSKKGGDDEQWLYLPSTKRLKRIAGTARTSSFRGSEFTFEDLADQNPVQYRFETVAAEACDAQQCFVLDRFPAPSLESSYSKTRLWIDQEHYRVIKADFYDADGKRFKSMQTYDYRLYDKRLWNPARIVMSNLVTGKATEMVSVNLQMNTGLKPSEFTELAIRAWR
ncbi:MAG: outer membrane lipoprotein-sorting protein [Gammaproteobacteria bacterium]